MHARKATFSVSSRTTSDRFGRNESRSTVHSKKGFGGLVVERRRRRAATKARTTAACSSLSLSLFVSRLFLGSCSAGSSERVRRQLFGRSTVRLVLIVVV